MLKSRTCANVLFNLVQEAYALFTHASFAYFFLGLFLNPTVSKLTPYTLSTLEHEARLCVFVFPLYFVPFHITVTERIIYLIFQIWPVFTPPSMNFLLIRPIIYLRPVRVRKDTMSELMVFLQSDNGSFIPKLIRFAGFMCHILEIYKGSPV